MMVNASNIVARTTRNRKQYRLRSGIGEKGVNDKLEIEFSQGIQLKVGKG